MTRTDTKIELQTDTKIESDTNSFRQLPSKAASFEESTGQGSSLYFEPKPKIEIN